MIKPEYLDEHSSHKLSDISHICLFKGCANNLLCSTCLKQHTAAHSSSIKRFNDILNLDPHAKIEETKATRKKSSDYLRKVYQHYDEIVQRVKSNIHSVFVKIMAISHEEEGEADIGLKDPEGLSVLASELESLKTWYFEIAQSNSKDARDTLSGYIEKYNTFLQKLEAENKSDNNKHIIALTHKELEDKTNALLKSFEEALSTFKNAFFKESYLNIQDIQQMTDTGNFPLPIQENVKPMLDFDISQLQKEISLKLAGPSSWNSVEYIETLGLVAVGDELGNIQLYNALDMKCSLTQNVHKACINTLKYSKNNNYLITASDDKTIKVLKIHKDSKIEKLYTLKWHKNKVWSLLLQEDQNLLYSSGKEAGIIVWDLKTLKLKNRIETGGKDTTGTEMTYIPRLKLLGVSFAEGCIAFYSIEVFTEVFVIRIRQKWLHTLVYLENRDELVAGTESGTIKVWKVGDYVFQPVKQHKVPGILPSSVVPMNDDKELLIASGRDQLISLNMETGELKGSCELGPARMTTVKVVPLMRRVFVGSQESSLMLAYY